MNFIAPTAFLLGLFGLATVAAATDTVRGTQTAYSSYAGIPERCVRITPVPDGNYSKDDVKDEQSLCGLDLYDASIAFCPKIWSTSAAVDLYDLTDTEFQNDRARFQDNNCETGRNAKYAAKDRLARLKFTMNQSTTSGTFSASSLLYYHLSRYLDLTTTVPVSVWRSMNKFVLLNEVVLDGVAFSAGQDDLKLNHSAWKTLAETLRDPTSYVKPGSYGVPDDILTSDGLQAYGALSDSSGDLYGAEINGLFREGDSPDDQYKDLLRTPAMIALATDAPIPKAIAKGLRDGATVLPDASTITAHQMVFWMREMSEIMLLDFILTQQDRLGNIEYRPYYYWLKDGKSERKRVRDEKPGEGSIPAEAVIILRTRINDNDTGGRTEYNNYTMRAGVLETLRHFDAGVYRRLLRLNQDFLTQGPIFDWLHSSLGLEKSQRDHIVVNTFLAVQILQATCLNGTMRFDLNPKRFFETGDTTPDPQSCSGN